MRQKDAAPAGTIGGTYCGNPLACAAAIKAMEIMKEEDYCAKSLHIGSVVRKAFEEMKEKYDIIGDLYPNWFRQHSRKDFYWKMQAPPVML